MAHFADYRLKLSLARQKNRRQIELKDHVSIGQFEMKLVLDWGGFYSMDRWRWARDNLRDYASELLTEPCR